MIKLLIMVFVFTLVFILIGKTREYSKIRSDVIVKTGYDISHPENWKGVCK